jgi:hypothetical protein
MTLEDHFTHTLAQRPAYTRNLKAMCKSCVNEVVLGQRMHLGLILQPPERLRKDDAIVILFERAP